MTKKYKIDFDGHDIHTFFKDVWKKHEHNTVGDCKHFLSKSDIVAIVVLSLISAFIILLTRFMIFFRWSTFPDNTMFYSWHPVTPWLVIAANFIYIYCLAAKKITFWLAYFPAVLSIIYCLIEAAMINWWLTPHDLATFFSMFGLYPPPSWLIG